jgi:branched-chain amino acid transport system permease protein
MRMLLAQARRLQVMIKTEILVLPSRIAVMLFAVFLLTAPLYWPDPYLLRVLTLASIFAIFAASWDLLSGFTGQVNFGHALFFGVAAYCAALLNLHVKLPPWATVPLGAVAAVAAGLVVGIPCLRLKGTYLALTTLSFPIILMGLVFAFPDLTGGELGVSGLSRLAPSRVGEYYVCVVLMLGAGFLMWKIGDSKTGIIFHAIREDELAVRAAGLNTTRYKILAFCLSGFFAGLAGGLYAHVMRIAGPSTLEVSLSFQAVIWAVFGGMVSIYGPIAAVFILFPLLELLRVVPQIRNLAFAVVILAILLYMPEGLIPWIRDRIEKICPRCKVRNFARRTNCRVCAAALH